MSRPQGSVSAKVTRDDIKNAFLQLKKLAAQGDVKACAELIRLDRESRMLKPRGLTSLE